MIYRHIEKKPGLFFLKTKHLKWKTKFFIWNKWLLGECENSYMTVRLVILAHRKKMFQ